MGEKRTWIIRTSASRFHSFFFHSMEIRNVSRYHEDSSCLCVTTQFASTNKTWFKSSPPLHPIPTKIRCFVRIRERKGQRCIIQRYTGRRKQDISLISILLRRYKSRGTRPRDSLRALVFLYFSFLSFSSSSPLSLFLSLPLLFFLPLHIATYHTVFRTFMLSLHWLELFTSCSRTGKVSYLH